MFLHPGNAKGVIRDLQNYSANLTALAFLYPGSFAEAIRCLLNYLANLIALAFFNPPESLKTISGLSLTFLTNLNTNVFLHPGNAKGVIRDLNVIPEIAKQLSGTPFPDIVGLKRTT